MDWKKTGKKLLKYVWQTFIILFIVLCILEVSYRYQWIDFFKTEFKALNKDLRANKSNFLVFGDSFTAHPNGYIDQLKEDHPSINFINCALPGSGPYEMELMASGRISEYPPTCVIYQMYVGNDLTDIAPPVNWSTLSFSRNMYWTMKNYFKIFGLFSRRLSGIQTDFDEMAIVQDTLGFAPELYSPRTKMMISANSEYVDQCVMLKGAFKPAFKQCKASISYLREIVPEKVPVYLVIIPHFSQVTEEYNERLKLLGGSITSMGMDYPLYKQVAEIKGVKVLNPLSFFREKEAEGIQMYYNNDPHLTDKGQIILANYLNQQLDTEWK